MSNKANIKQYKNTITGYIDDYDFWVSLMSANQPDKPYYQAHQVVEAMILSKELVIVDKG